MTMNRARQPARSFLVGGKLLGKVPGDVSWCLRSRVALPLENRRFATVTINRARQPARSAVVGGARLGLESGAVGGG
ncbi:hypothetical protein, partial [Actinospica sp.]|uniref:hypothetical protein n=1 Tax=Actinospica sp. TaxID=1872142 RepID=UPI002D011D27